jgi:FMN hydrolase / 5-amino-6-(5-phospho-D-ribitylamino)uracil phosphatase
MIQARIVLFDVLGTLVVDPFYERMPATLGMTFDELIAAKTPDAWLQFERGEIDEAEFFRTFFLDGRSFDQAALKHAVVDGWAWLPGVESILHDLAQANVTRHGLSNYPVWMHELDEKIGLSAHLGQLFVSCDLGVRKPHAGAYVHVLDALGMPAHEILFIDDRKENVTAAEELGMHAHHFCDAETLRADLVARGLLSA